MRLYNIWVIIFFVAWCSRAAFAADCDLADIGKHPQPPKPVHPPAIKDQYAYFEWGSDAYLDASHIWWARNYIRNDASVDGPGLAVNWKEGGIFIPLVNPLPGGETACRTQLLGDDDQEVPILNKDAPIVYGVSSQIQRAAVYIERPNGPTQTPKGADAAVSTIQTAYLDKGVLRPVFVSVTSKGSGPKLSISITKEPADLIVGISGLSEALGPEQVKSFSTQLTSQGFTFEQAVLTDYVKSEVVAPLFSRDDFLTRKTSLVFLGKGGSAYLDYGSYKAFGVRPSPALLMILDSDHQLLAVDTINIILPQTN